MKSKNSVFCLFILLILLVGCIGCNGTEEINEPNTVESAPFSDAEPSDSNTESSNSDVEPSNSKASSIRIPFSAEELCGQKCSVIKEKLEIIGFSHIYIMHTENLSAPLKIVILSEQ